VTNERDELLRLIEELPEDRVPAVLDVIRRYVRPEGANRWPPAFFAGAPGDGLSIADDAGEPRDDGFAR
jgi:hypothetical protein